MADPKRGNLPTGVTTPRFRVSYPALFTPKMNTLSGQKEYSVQALFEKGADLSSLQAMAKNAAINLWGTDPAKWPGKMKSPFKKQSELIAKAKEKDQKFDHLDPDAYYMTFKSMAVNKKTGKDNAAPIVVGKNPKDVIKEESKFYGGCWAKANVNASAFDKGGPDGNKGITFYLNACQFVADGEPFGGRPNPEKAFEAIPEDAAPAGAAAATGSAQDMFSSLV